MHMGHEVPLGQRQVVRGGVMRKNPQKTTVCIALC
jgi:hypothetical protein